MTYEINGERVWYAIDRTKIVDISVGDTLSVKGLPDAHYVWNEQDQNFMENNPDADLFLEIEKGSEGQFKGGSIVLI